MTAHARDSDHALKFTVVLPECVRGCKGEGVCAAKTLRQPELSEWYRHKSDRRERYDCGCLIVERLSVEAAGTERKG